MTTDVIMPALSPTMEKGTLARWLVAPGTGIKAGDVIAEIETDKASMEIEAVSDGVLSEILVSEGTDDVPVGTPIARLSSGVAATPSGAGRDSGGGGETRADERSLSPSARRAAKSSDVDLNQITGTGRGGRVTKTDILKAAGEPIITQDVVRAAPASQDLQMTPLARRFAAASRLDLAALVGRGRIGLRDIMPSKPAVPAPLPAALEGPGSVNPVAGNGAPFEMEKLSAMRRTIARRLGEAKREIPHIYLAVDVRIDPLLKLRAELNETLATRGIKLSVNDFFIRAQALALLAESACNVEFTSDGVKRFSRADISVAVSIPNGLVTPVVTDAGTRSLAAIGQTMRDLAGRARDGKLAPEEYQGGTASLSNLGMFGIKQFQAIINPPQAMILAIGAGDRRLELVDGAVVERSIITATGSFDHRAIDGADAAAFMNRFRELVESPMLLIA